MPGLLAVLTPVIVGKFAGAALGGLLAGVTVWCFNGYISI